MTKDRNDDQKLNKDEAELGATAAAMDGVGSGSAPTVAGVVSEEAVEDEDKKSSTD